MKTPSTVKLSPADGINALLASAERAIQHFIAAENAGQPYTASARLLAHAENDLHNLVCSIERGPLTSAMARSWLIALSDIQAFLLGAIAVDELKPRATLAIAALKNVKAMVKTLEAQHWPEESEDDCRRREFMAGKALAVDMLEDAHDVERAANFTPKSELFAKWRGRDVPQDVFCMDYFDQVEVESSLRAGFFAVVAQAIFEASDVIAPDEIRNATFDDCYGGPDTAYTSEEDMDVTPVPADKDAMLDKLDALLSAAAAVTFGDSNTTMPAVLQAMDSSGKARQSTRKSDFEAHLQQVRRHVYKARESGDFELNPTDEKRAAQGSLLAAHRLLNTVLGGVMLDDRPENEPRTPLGVVIDRLDIYLDGTEHVNPTEAVHSLMHSAVWPLFFEVAEAELRGHEEGALRLLPKLRTNIAATFGQCDANEGSWALLKVSLEVLDEFLITSVGKPAVQPPQADGSSSRSMAARAASMAAV